jgi:hypothetical protein
MKTMTDITNDFDKTKNWWWLAVNGASCAACFMAMPATVTVIPMPEQLIGFESREEQLAAQEYVLTAPIDDVAEFMNTTILNKVESGEVAYIRPQSPEPQPDGPTMWMCG